MKIAAITECLTNYDSKKGYGRTIIKDEPHIGELRVFHKKFLEEDRELTSEELFNLVSIILGKHTWNDAESSKNIQELAKHLGGKDALINLQEHKALTEHNVLLMEKYHEYGDLISKFIVLINKNSVCDETVSQMLGEIDLSCLDEKLAALEPLAQAQILNNETFTLVMKNPYAICISDILLLLKRHGLCNEENITRLQKIKEPQILEEILSIFDKNPKLMLQSNLASIFEHGNFNEVAKKLKSIPLVEQLDLDTFLVSPSKEKAAPLGQVAKTSNFFQTPISQVIEKEFHFWLNEVSKL